MNTTKRKGYDERKNHIIQAANGLFLQKGYEAASVDDILERAGISKGTFYHYFSHKLELLEAIVDNFTLSYIEPLEAIVDRTGSAVDKLNTVFELNQFLKKENESILKQVMAIFFKEENLIYKQRLNNRIKEVLTPYLFRILEQGLEEGSFDHADARETANLVVQLIFSSRDRLVEELMKPEPDVKVMTKVMKTYQQCLERMLAVPTGSLKALSTGLF